MQMIFLCLLISGEFQIGDHIQPLDPEWVQSIVQFRVLRSPVTYQAEGYSLVYNQLYPKEGLQNYTSGIIHHVLLTGMIWLGLIYISVHSYKLSSFWFKVVCLLVSTKAPFSIQICWLSITPSFIQLEFRTWQMWIMLCAESMAFL